MKHLIRLSLLLALGTSLTGCAMATAGIKKGDERSFVRSVNDVNAGRVIEARMTRALDYKLKGVDVEVAEGVVLLSGNVPTQTDKIEAVRIAWSAPRIDQVGNEIMVKSKQGFFRNTKDGILEKSVRARLTADRLVKARNFNVETHDGIVYLMGVARTRTELERAAQLAAITRGTKQVISYARVAELSAPARAEAQAEADYILNPTRSLPDVLQAAPSGPIPVAPSYQADVPQVAAPITNLPLSEPIPFEAPAAQALQQAPSEINMGNRLGKEFPTEDELGAYRTGAAGEAVSIIESAPYYVDPDTGKEIPIRFDADGNIVPLLIK